MLFSNKLFNSIACLLSFTNLQLVIPVRTCILLYLGRTVYKHLWACLALYVCQEFCPQARTGEVSAPLHAGIHPHGQTPPGKTPPDKSSQADIPPGQTPAWKTPSWAVTHLPPPPRWPLQWTVRILLECILFEI